MSIALRFLHIIEQECQVVKEAQMARGIKFHKPKNFSLRETFLTLQGAPPFFLPLIILTVKRAWNLTEAAYLRGIDGPFEAEAPSFGLKRIDYAFIIYWGIFYLAVFGGLYIWKITNFLCSKYSF